MPVVFSPERAQSLARHANETIASMLVTPFRLVRTAMNYIVSPFSYRRRRANFRNDELITISRLEISMYFDPNLSPFWIAGIGRLQRISIVVAEAEITAYNVRWNESV